MHNGRLLNPSLGLWLKFRMLTVPGEELLALHLYPETFRDPGERLEGVATGLSPGVGLGLHGAVSEPVTLT